MYRNIECGGGGCVVWNRSKPGMVCVCRVVLCVQEMDSDV
jgi:hypothetical protein